ncbi:hypothetical protein N2152v2_001310 [Parachlorella kessleri]
MAVEHADQGRLAPPLRQALAVAIVQRRRQDAEAQKWTHEVKELEEEISQLRQSPAKEEPLQLLGRLADSALEVADEQAVIDLSSAELWHQALATLSAHQQFLNTLQRYLLSKELKERPAANPLPGVLGRTPLQAALELISDLLEAHKEQSPAAGVGAAASSTTLTEAHGRVLLQATGCLAALVRQAAGLMSQEDGLCLGPFFGYIVAAACHVSRHEAATTDGSPSLGTPDQQQVQPPSQERHSDAAAIDLTKSTAAVALQLVSALCSSAGTGLVLLGAAASAAEQYVHSLVAEVTGEHLAFPPSALHSLDSASEGHHPEEHRQLGDSTIVLGEEALAHAVVQVAGVLHTALPLLAAWAAEVGGCDEAFMSGVASAIMSAKDACKLIAITHSSIARLMQRVAAQLVNALSQLAAMEDG